MTVNFREAMKATQWFKDGDHPAVEFEPNNHVFPGQHERYVIDTIYDNEDKTEIKHGMWIVEMPIGIMIFDDDNFRKLFQIMWFKKHPNICKNCHGEEYGSPCDGKAYCGGMPEMVLKRLAKVGQSTEGMEL